MRRPSANRRNSLMDPKKMGKQMIDFYKTSFNNSFNAMMMVQEQMERMSSMFMEQFANMPEDGKKAINEWIKAYKKGCEEFKKSVDDNFRRVEDYFTESEKHEKSKAA